MTSKLTIVAIAAAVIGTSATASAQGNSKEQGKQSAQDASKQQSKPKAQPQQDVKQQQGAQQQKPAAASEGAKKSGDAAGDVNEDVVGEKTQRQNELKARDPRNSQETPKSQQETKESAEKVGSATTSAAETVMETTKDVTRAVDKPGKYNPVSIALNPLGFMVGGRFSLNIEWAPVTHHVLIFSPHIVSTSGDVTQPNNVSESQTYAGFGSEVGYRYYTGHKGMNGLFIGPSLIAGAFNASTPGGNDFFTNFGIAVDAGFQAVVANHLVLGAGLGIEYLTVSEDYGDLPSGPYTIAQRGLKPRVLASVGYAF